MPKLSPLPSRAPPTETLPGRPAGDADLELLADEALGQLISAEDLEGRRLALELMLTALRLRSPERIHQLEAERLARCGILEPVP